MLEITGGTVQTTNGYALTISTASGNVTISGGTLKSTAWGTINHRGTNAKLTISGNAVIECYDSNTVIHVFEETSSLEIQGGRIIGNYGMSCKCPVLISGGDIAPKITAMNSITITGGVLRNGVEISESSEYDVKNSAGDLLKQYAVRLIDADNNPITNTAVTSLSTVDPLDYTYGLNNVKTDTQGYLYVWLPADKTGGCVIVGGSTYSGAITYDNENAIFKGTLRLPSQIPAADVTSVAKNTASQANVSFTLTTAPTGTWKVYDSDTATEVIAGVSAALSGTTLTLTESDGNIEAMSYYVAVAEPNKNESERLALTVQSATVVNAEFPVITNDLSTARWNITRMPR